MYGFTPEKYPRLAKCTTESEMYHFCIDHILKHLAKNVGAIASQSENFDHTGMLNFERLEEAGVKLLINALNLLSVLRVTATEILAKMRKELH